MGEPVRLIKVRLFVFYVVIVTTYFVGQRMSVCKCTLPVILKFVDNPASVERKEHECSVDRQLATNSA